MNQLLRFFSQSKTDLLVGGLLCFSLLSDAAFAQKVNVNQATREELQELPGVGPKLADAIATDREENGRFRSVEDLARVPGISAGLVQKLFDAVHVGGRVKKGGVIIKEGETIDASVVRQVLEQFKGEPSVREVQKAAINYANANPDIVDSLRGRVRASAALPEFRLRVKGDIDDDTTEVVEPGVANQTRESDDLGVEGYVQAKWNLDKLLFHNDELGIARETVRLSNLRNKVVSEVTRRFFERRRLQVDLELSPSTDLSSRIRKELRIQELTADIDALTGGWFSKSLEQLSREAY
ncbi:MAG: ComEA family DNA-binding protein [Deltaproteobacteria bacterium]|nr:ComEA family DNA-binding protein [Deltaproteobacteria bacterium]